MNTFNAVKLAHGEGIIEVTGQVFVRLARIYNELAGAMFIST